MEDSRWLRVITVGLVLAAMAVAYFLLTGKLSSNSVKVQSQVNKVVVSPFPSPSSSVILGLDIKPSPTPVISPSPSPVSAYNTIVNRNQTDITTLPKTGFPTTLVIIFSLSAIVSGFSLRQFPK